MKPRDLQPAQSAQLPLSTQPKIIVNFLHQRCPGISKPKSVTYNHSSYIGPDSPVFTYRPFPERSHISTSPSARRSSSRRTHTVRPAPTAMLARFVAPAHAALSRVSCCLILLVGTATKNGRWSREVPARVRHMCWRQRLRLALMLILCRASKPAPYWQAGQTWVDWTRRGEVEEQQRHI